MVIIDIIDAIYILNKTVGVKISFRYCQIIELIILIYLEFYSSMYSNFMQCLQY